MKFLRKNSCNFVFRRYITAVAHHCSDALWTRRTRLCGSGRASCDVSVPYIGQLDSELLPQTALFPDRCPQLLEKCDNLQYLLQERQAVSLLPDAYVPLLLLLNNLVSFLKNQNSCPVPLPMQSRQMTPLFTGQVE